MGVHKFVSLLSHGNSFKLNLMFEAKKLWSF